MMLYQLLKDSFYFLSLRSLILEPMLQGNPNSSLERSTKGNRNENSLEDEKPVANLDDLKVHSLGIMITSLKRSYKGPFQIY